MTTPTRRNLIFGGVALGVATAGYELWRADQSIPPRSTAAEARFRQLQDFLLVQDGVHATSRFFDLPNPAIRAHVVEAGQGDPVLMIHGGYGVAVQWLPLLGTLAHDLHVYAPDRPGCGLTQMFNYTGVPFREHAVAFVRSTMDALELPKAALIGNSMGGYFSLVFALAHPERVSKLVAIGEPAGSSASIPMSQRIMATRGIDAILYATVMKPGPKATRESFQRVLVAHPERIPGPYFDCMTAAALIPGATESWLTMLQSVVPWNGRSALTYALRAEFSKLTMPALMIWGEKDTFGPPARGAEMVALMPDAKLEVLPDAGHLAWLDQPVRSAKLIESFLRA